MNEPRTAIAVAGAGLMGQVHMRAVSASSTVYLSAVVDPSPLAVEVAAQAGVPLFSSIDALLENARPDGLVLATPNALHAPQALQCIAAKLPILLEKPVATTVAEAAQLVQAAQEAQVSVLVGHHRAHSAIMAKAREVVQSGRLGRLVSVMGSAQFFKPDAYFAEAPWRSQIGGGPILINMIHEVHNLRMLCGEVTAVQAFASNAVRAHAVEDTVAINLRFANGVLGTFMLSDVAACSKSWEQTSQENKAYANDAREDCYVISGTLGSLSIPTMRVSNFANKQERSWYRAMDTSQLIVGREDPIDVQMAHFGDVVRGQAKPLVSLRDGYANLCVTEAIAQSARTGLVVDVGALKG